MRVELQTEFSENIDLIIDDLCKEDVHLPGLGCSNLG